LFGNIRNNVDTELNVSNDELIYAFSFGNLEYAMEYVEAGFDVNGKILDTRSPFASLLHTDRLSMNVSPLYIARSEDWYPRVAEYLLDQGADPNFTDEKGQSLLMHAAAARNINGGHDQAQPEFVEMLVEYGADINQKSEEGYTALDYAVANRYRQIVAYLLENGAELSQETLSLTKDNAWSGYSYEITKHILEAGIEDGLHYEDPLVEAAVLGDSDKTIELLKQNRGEYPEEIPFFIASYCDIDALKYLADNGVDLNLKDNSGTSLLGFAAKGGKVENVEYLASQGAEINPTAWSSLDFSPLSLSMQENNYETASCLLQQGAEFFSPEYGIWGGMSVSGEGVSLPRNELEAAAVNGNIEMIELLRQYDYPFNNTNVIYAGGIAIEKNQLNVVNFFLKNEFVDVNCHEGNKSLLSFATDAGNIDAVELLLQYGARSEEDDAIIAGASRFGNYAVVERLAKNGVSKNALNTALVSATEHGNFDIVKLLVESGATDIQAPVLFAAAMGSHILQYFLDQGAEINYQFEKNSNNTALMVAAANQNSFGVKALLEAGADTTLTNTQGQTALDLAKKTRNSAIIKMLEPYEQSGKKNSG
jgi:ankyrin repeat protein